MRNANQQHEAFSSHTQKLTEIQLFLKENILDSILFFLHDFYTECGD
jgi:hypothetical protein